MGKLLLPDADEVVAGRRLRAIGAFQTSELFVLSAVRLWCDPIDVPCRRVMVRNGFHAAGLDFDHYRLFANLMDTINATAIRPLCAATMGCVAPTPDETWLLECLALSQHQSADAETFLGTRLPPAGLAAVSGILPAFTAALTSAGLHLRVRSMAETRERARPVATLWRHLSTRALH